MTGLKRVSLLVIWTSFLGMALNASNASAPVDEIVEKVLESLEKREDSANTQEHESLHHKGSNPKENPIKEQEPTREKEYDLFSRSVSNVQWAVELMTLSATLLAIVVAAFLTTLSGVIFLVIRFYQDTNVVRKISKDLEKKVKEHENRLAKMKDEADVLYSLVKKSSPEEIKESKVLKKQISETSERIKFREELGGKLSAEDYVSRGINLALKGEHKEALQELDKASVIDSKNANAYFWKGYSLTALKEYKEALEAYNKAIELDPKNAAAWSNKGHSLNELKRHEEALEACNKAIQLDSKSPKTFRHKGYALAFLERYKEALEVLDKAIKIDPDYGEAYYTTAITYLKMNESKDKVLEKLEKAFELESDLKEKARTNKAFESLWNDDDFKKLTEPE